jgi:hypothetical protein
MPVERISLTQGDIRAVADATRCLPADVKVQVSYTIVAGLERVMATWCSGATPGGLVILHSSTGEVVIKPIDFYGLSCDEWELAGDELVEVIGRSRNGERIHVVTKASRDEVERERDELAKQLGAV